MKPIMLGNWENPDTWCQGPLEDFQTTEAEREGVEILVADYQTPAYEGYAFVLFRKDGKLYEVNGSHCSCNGLEGQWKPEEVVLAELLQRPALKDIMPQIVKALEGA